MTNATQQKRFSLRLPPDVKKQLARRAAEEGRSINAQAVRLLRSALNQQAA